MYILPHFIFKYICMKIRSGFLPISDEKRYPHNYGVLCVSNKKARNGITISPGNNFYLQLVALSSGTKRSCFAPSSKVNRQMAAPPP